MALPAREAKAAPSEHGDRRDKKVELRRAGIEHDGKQAAFVVRTTHAEIAVRQSAGRKLPVLLIHGNSMSKDVFRAQVESVIGQEYRLIAVDLPGHGQSSDAFDPQRSYAMPGYADAMVEVIEALGLEHVAVVGWSLGGHVALEMMAAYPDLVGVMAIAAPPFEPTPEGIQRAFKDHPDVPLLSKKDLTEDEMSRLVRTAAGGVDQPELHAAVRRADGRARQLMFEALLSGRVSNQRWLAENTAQVSLAIVNGAGDPFVAVDYLPDLHYANLWRGTCHRLPRARHAPMIEVPQIFNNLLSSFLSDMADIARTRTEDPSLAYSA